MSSTLGNFIISDNITLDVPRAGFQCIQIGNTIYAIGGRLSKDINTPVSSISHASIENGSIGNFEPSSDITLDVPRADFQCIQIGDNVYAIGGIGNNRNVYSSIGVATITNGSLSSFKPADITLDVPRTGFQCIQIDDNVYAIGGGGDNNHVRSIGVATITNGSLSSFTTTDRIALDIPRLFFHCIQIGDNVYAIGGGVINITSIGVATITNGSLSSFTTAGITLDTDREALQCIQIGDNVYAIGGAFVDSIGVATITNGSLSSFTTADITLDVPRADFQCIQIGNNVYAIGGAENDTSLLSSISIAPIISNPCFLSTTEILVDIDTYKTAKDIKVGEYISFFNTTSRVTRVIKSKIEDYEKLGDNKIFKIPKDFFSHGLPDKDTYLSGYHRLIFPSKTGFLGVQVFKCVPETNIIKTEKELLDITGENKLYYYNIELENNGFALVANNMAIESYVKS